MNRRLQIVLLVAFFWLLFSPAPAAAQTAKRLILKDGSYQLASQWEVSGDRVRYLSSERNEWEEVPASMVDWQATENFQQQRESQRQFDLKLSQAKDESEAKLTAGPVVAPGLQLPNSAGVYLLDRYHGELQLIELIQSSGEVNRQTGHSVLRPIIPITSSKQSIELEGEHARTQSHLPQPAIFIAVDPDSGSQPLPLAERFRIARLEPKKDARVVGSLKVTITGKVSQQEFYLPATAEPLPGGGWVRLTPSQPLSPGEYAVVEMLDAKTVNSSLWDFGVNPSAPENPGVWKAAPESNLPAGTATPSALETPPR